MLPKVKTLRHTILACPSQYEGETAEGNYIYIRYRSGNLRAGIWESEAAMWKQIPWVYNVFDEKVGEYLDGWLDYEKMKELLKDFLDFSETQFEDPYTEDLCE